MGLVLVVFLPALQGFGQEDKIGQIAIETIKTQMRPPKEMEIKFLEKKESPIPNFYSVKLLISSPDRDIPIVVYVDKAGERVILGNLIVRGENVTRREAGEPKPRKIDMGQLNIEKSPFRGSADGKVTIVEFVNFQCEFCLRSWTIMKESIKKHSKEVKYVFKHFPLQTQGMTFDLSVMVAAVQEVGNEAFWVVHDFMFSDEGQALGKGEKEAAKQKIEEILKGKGYNVKAFETALETGKAKKRVEEDMALGNKIRVTGTPTAIVNGDYIRGSLTDKALEQYLGR